MESRRYRMRRRAAAVEETRARILRATFALHAEKGIAATTQSDVAARAGIAPATVYRHFPTQGALVRFCGEHVWEVIAPLRPEDAAGTFEGLSTTAERLRRLADAVGAFYARAALPLQGARAERRRIPEVDEFLGRIEAGLDAFARAALGLEGAAEEQVRLVRALIDFGVWQALREHGVGEDEAPRLIADLLCCALDGSRTRTASD